MERTAPAVPAAASGTSALRKPDRSRMRAAILAGVYVLMALHWAHWQITGSSLAPLELNEVMHTLELGVVTAGFLFMCAATLSVLIFGRFFCSWGCHIIALEDGAAWLLAKVRIRPKLIRSRALLLVPVSAMAYMFVWPQLKRVALAQWPQSATLLGEMPPFEWRVLAQGEGWASFITSDYARNLPGPGVAVLTFIVVGAVMVYVLGTRAFCRLACPYGALFAAADRLAPGRIVLDGPCTGCGQCTAACSSHVRVHEETKAWGKVVDTACLKDLDCVAACPQGSLRFGFSMPRLFSKPHATPPPSRFDFTLGEDTLAALVFLFSLLVFRGLYGLVPFLLALAVAGMIAAAAVMVLRLLRREQVDFGKRTLKAKGRLTGQGKAACTLSLAVFLLTGHSAFVRWHEWRGTEISARIAAAQHGSANGNAGTASEADDIDEALRHLNLRARFGLAGGNQADQQVIAVAAAAQRPQAAVGALQRMIAREPTRAALHRALGEALAAAGQLPEARAALLHAVRVEPSAASFHDLGCIQAAAGDYTAAEQSFLMALRVDDKCAEARESLTRLRELQRR